MVSSSYLSSLPHSLNHSLTDLLMYGYVEWAAEELPYFLLRVLPLSHPPLPSAAGGRLLMRPSHIDRD